MIYVNLPELGLNWSGLIDCHVAYYPTRDVATNTSRSRLIDQLSLWFEVCNRLCYCSVRFRSRSRSSINYPGWTGKMYKTLHLLYLFLFHINMIMSTKLLHSVNHIYKIRNTPLQQTNSAKYLGVTIDDSLSSDSHISNTYHRYAAKSREFQILVSAGKNLCWKQCVGVMFFKTSQ